MLRLRELLTAVRDRLLAPLVTPMPAHRRGWIHAQHSWGEVIADLVVEGMGSWRFIIVQTVVVLLWMILNTVAFIGHWDPMPFILLNLVFSTQAAYASPLILMAANRAATKDRARDEHEAEEVDALYAINQQQIKILRQQSKILAMLQKQHGPPRASQQKERP